MAQLGIAVLIPPTKAQRKTMLKMVRRVIAKWRNRVESSFGEITDRMELARHGARTFWGLLTRTAATLAAPHAAADQPERNRITHNNPHNAPEVGVAIKALACELPPG